MNQVKKIPLRKCVVSNKMYPKKELIRVVRTPELTIIIDQTGKANGRGAYIRPDLEVLATAKKSRALERALKCKIDPDFYDLLEREIQEGWD